MNQLEPVHILTCDAEKQYVDRDRYGGEEASMRKPLEVNLSISLNREIL